MILRLLSHCLVLQLMFVDKAAATQTVYLKILRSYENQTFYQAETELEKSSVRIDSEWQDAREATKLKMQSSAETSLLLHGNTPPARNPELQVGSRPLVVSQMHQFSASKTIIDFGRSAAEQAKLNIRHSFVGVAESNLKRTAQREASRDIFSLAKARERLETNQSLLTAAQRKTELHAAMYKRGDRSSQDVLLAEVQQNRVKLQVESARSELQLLLTRLGNKTRLDPGELAQATLNKHTPPEITKLIAAVSNASLATTSINKDPEWMALESQKSLLQADIDAVDSSYRPIVQGTIGTRVPGQLIPLKPQVYAALSFDWTLPTSGEGNSRKESLTTQKKLIELRQLRLAERLKKEEAATALDGNSFEQEWDVLQAQEKLLREWEKVVQDRLKSGRATALDLVSAEDSLVNLELEKWSFLMRWRERIFERALVQENWPLTISFFKE